MLLATDPQFHSHLLLSIHTGIRMSEQYTLEWSQIDFGRRQMYLPRTNSGDPRDVPLNSTAVFRPRTAAQGVEWERRVSKCGQSQGLVRRGC